MRVLFIYPNSHNESRINLGIAYLSACLKKAGHQVKLFDTTFYKINNQLSDDELRTRNLQVKGIDLFKYGVRYKTDDFLYEDFRNIVDDFQPNMLALSCVDATYHLGKRLIESVKDFNIFTIVGGIRSTVDPLSIIKEDWVNALCIGEGEEAIVELCNAISYGKSYDNVQNLWVKSGKKLFKNQQRPLVDLNYLPIPDWGIFDYKHFIRPFAGKVYRMGCFKASRGCPYKCSYCVNQYCAAMYKENEKYYRIKDPGQVIKDIKYHIQKYNLNFIHFYDELFPTAVNFINGFCELYQEIKIPFSINMRPEIVNEEVIEKLVAVGLCNVCIGIESGDYEFRKKVLNRNCTNEAIIKSFNIIRKHKIRTSSFNMIGLPFETREHIFKTIELNRTARPSSATVSFFYPYRGTFLRDVCIKENFFDPSEEENIDIGHRTYSSLIMPQISKEEINVLFNRFQLYFKLPRILWPLIKITEKQKLVGNIILKMLILVFNYYSKNDFVWNFKTELAGRQSIGV